MSLPTARWRSKIEKICAQYYPPVPSDVLEAMVLVESGGDPNARSASNAIGLTQIIYKWHTPLVNKVAAGLGKAGGEQALYDPDINLRVGASHLRWCYTSSGSQSWELAVKKYFTGSATPPPGFVDGQGTSPDQHIQKLRTALQQVREDRNAPQEHPMASHRFVLSAGHRNTNRGGARGEITWTYPSVVALKAAIEARGGTAVIVQQVAGGSESTFYNGGLQAAARACVDLAKAYGPFDAYISSHYNGGASPGFHAIFPDAWNGVDIKANNPLDVKLCRAIRDRVKATNTVKMVSWTKDSPGVMSERETGVGAQGYRLGEFVGTIGFRDTTARVIIEASSIDVASEARYITDPHWVRHVYCEAIVDALEDVFGAFPKPKPQPEPQPVPDTVYAAASPITGLDPSRMVQEVDGSIFYRSAMTVVAIRDTPRLRLANAASDHTGPKVKAGETFDIEYLFIADDGNLYAITPWWTRILAEDIEPVPASAGEEAA